jgi:hypothetical protein
MREAYSFLGDSCVTAMRPQAVREIHAVKALRTGEWSPRPGAMQPQVGRIRRDVDEMLRRGWKCPPEAYMGYKEQLWKQNREMLRKVLAEFEADMRR